MTTRLDPGADNVAPRRRLAAVRDAVGAAVGVVLGLAPHVLHHVSFIAGAALVTGAGGNALFYLVGLVFSVPMLRRIHRRFRSWWAPAIAIAIFTGLFSLSAFVIGPAVSGTDDPGPSRDPAPTSPTPSDEHSEHH
jgi:hypothetical protein